MKVEHREAIERARLHGVEPMVFAHQLLVHDLVEAAMFELRNNKMPFGRLGEDDQQEVIDRVTKVASEAATTAVGIISSRSVETIAFTVADSKFKAKNITVTGVVDAQDPNRHGLIDLAGKLVLLVLAPNDYTEGLDGIKAERDQHELPLSASEIIAGAGLDRRQEEQPELDALVNEERHPVDKIIEQGDAGSTVLGKEFGDYDYDDAKQLVVLKSNGSPFKTHWLQSRLALSTEQVTALLIRLLDDKVLELEEEGDSSMDHIYKVVATLEQVV